MSGSRKRSREDTAATAATPKDEAEQAYKQQVAETRARMLTVRPPSIPEAYDRCYRIPYDALYMEVMEAKQHHEHLAFIVCQRYRATRGRLPMRALDDDGVPCVQPPCLRLINQAYFFRLVRGE